MPNEVLEHIFGCLDGRTLITMTETCVKFKLIIELHPKLFDGIWWTLSVRQETDEEIIEALKLVRESNRRYKKVCIRYIKSSWFDDPIFVDVLEHFGQTVTVLATDSIKFKTRKDFVDTLRLFPHLRRLQLKHIEIEDENNAKTEWLDETVDLPHLKDLYLVEYYPWLLDVLSPCVHVNKLESYIVKWLEEDIHPVENFLFRQKSLKRLNLGIFRRCRMFPVDRSHEVQFQLDELLLNGANFVCKEILLKFIKTQPRLKMMQINLLNESERKLDELLFYNDIVQFILIKLPELTSLMVTQDRFKFPDLNFIRCLPPNEKITKLDIQGIAVDTFTALVTHILPNIKILKYQTNHLHCNSVPLPETINLMTNLESVHLELFFVQHLRVFQLPKLKKFDFTAREIGVDMKKAFRIFFERHQSLTELRIGVFCFIEHNYITHETCEDIVNNLTSLESLNVQNFHDPDSQVCYLVNNAKCLKHLRLSTNQFKKLSPATLDECSLNKICVEIGK